MNIKEQKANYVLKHFLIDTFCNSDVTPKNRANIERMLTNLKDLKLKKELITKIKIQKGKSSSGHHKTQVEY